MLEQLRVDALAHRLNVLYGGVGADDSPLPLGVSEADVVEMLDRYQAAASRLSAQA